MVAVSEETIAVCGSSYSLSSAADAATDAVLLLAITDVDAATTAVCGSSCSSSSAADAAMDAAVDANIK